MGNLVKILLVAGLVYGGYQWSQSSTGPSQVTMSMPTNLEKDHVMVVAAINCPKEAAQQAERITQNLKSNHIPVQRVHRVSFKPTSREDAKRIQAVMKGGPPLVFYQGKAVSKATWEDVLAMVPIASEQNNE